MISETGNGLEAITLATQLQPDILIVEVKLPGLSGLEVTRQVRQRLPNTRVLILSRYPNESYMLEALRYDGAAGYVLKDVSIGEFVQAVDAVVSGRRYLSAPLAERVARLPQQGAGRTLRDPYETLTRREREVLHLAAEGRTYTEIATALGIGGRTVETHRAHFMHKLGLRTQTELVRYAVQRGLLPTMEE